MSVSWLIWKSIVHFHLELEELQSHIKSGKVYQYPRPKETIEMYKDGGIAIIDQWIAAHGRLVFFTNPFFLKLEAGFSKQKISMNCKKLEIFGGMVNWTKLVGMTRFNLSYPP